MVRGRSGLTLSNCSSFDGNHASGFLGRLTNHRPAAVVAATQRQNTWARTVTGTRGEHRGDRLPPVSGSPARKTRTTCAARNARRLAPGRLGPRTGLSAAAGRRRGGGGARPPAGPPVPGAG